jgi:hypothetical protein
MRTPLGAALSGNPYIYEEHLLFLHRREDNNVNAREEVYVNVGFLPLYERIDTYILLVDVRSYP